VVTPEHVRQKMFNFTTMHVWHLNSMFTYTQWPVAMQMSMSVRKTMEAVALWPPAPTLQVTWRVPVYPNTPEMDSPVQVSGTKWTNQPLFRRTILEARNGK